MSSNRLDLGRVKGYSDFELWQMEEGNEGGSYAMYELTRKGETGATGADGAEGVQGIQGVQGEQGEQGVEGQQGIQGIQGLNGEDGTALKVSFTIQSKEELDTHTDEEYNEKIALVINEGAYYSYSPNIDSGEYSWTYLPNVGTGTQGPEGPQGIQGVQGEQGPQGIQGEQGVQGVQGLNGIQGIQGEQGETISDMSLSTNTFEPTTLDNVNVVRMETNTGRALYFDVITKSVEGPQGVQGEQGIQGVSGVSANMSSEYEVLYGGSIGTLAVDGYKTITISGVNLYEYTDFRCGGSTWGQGKVIVTGETTVQVYNNTTWSSSLSGIYARKLKGQISDPSVIGPQGEQGIQGPAGENGIMTQEIYDSLMERIQALEEKILEE